MVTEGGPLAAVFLSRNIGGRLCYEFGPIMANRLRGALAGFGFISARGHAPSYLADNRVEILAIADLSDDQRKVARTLFPGARIYDAADEMIAAEHPRLDFIDIATPPRDHAKIAHQALDRGLHVLCEKPLAASPAEGRAMLDHARAARRVVYPCHNYKHAPIIKLVREALQSGLVGDVNLVTLQTFRNTHAKGVAGWRPDWRRDGAYAGGGIAMDHGSHTFYLAFEWMGSYPTAISAHTATHGPYDTEDNFNCTMSFPTGSASAHLSWTSGMRKVLYTIHGTGGAIRVDDEDMELAVLEGGPGSAGPGSPGTWRIEKRVAKSDWMDASHAGWFSSLFGEFRRAIDHGEYVGKDARESLLCLELIHRGYASARSECRMVPLPGVYGTPEADLAPPDLGPRDVAAMSAPALVARQTLENVA
jgi:predicted dehydrogenase